MEKTCLVCGFYDESETIFSPDNKDAYQEICPCCGTQFGYDDAGPKGKDFYRKILREKWIKNGMKFWSQAGKPKNWDPIMQLQNLQNEELYCSDKNYCDISCKPSEE